VSTRPFRRRREGESVLGRPAVVDALIAAGFLVFALVAFFTAERSPHASADPDVLGAIFVVVASGALAFRRRWPLPVFVVVAGAALTLHVLGYPDGGLPFAVALAVYTMASLCDRRLVVGLTAVVVLIAPIAFWATDTVDDGGTLVGTLAVFVLAAVWGDRRKVRIAYDEQLALREAEKERERIESERRAVADERLRIARELHDVLAHAMSVVAVQSGVGVHVIDSRPAEAKRILQTINATSRESMKEMRSLVDVLRENPELHPDELAPAPGLEQLPELVGRVTEAGVPVDVTVEGERGAVPAGVDLAAYRIAQEALTNILKHAGPARAGLTVRYERDALHLEIVDDGRGAAAGRVAVPFRSNGTGHGLVGMRERAALYDGALEAGPRPGGGYRVAATLRYGSVPAP
jgi:signal transduction histidine kinase